MYSRSQQYLCPFKAFVHATILAISHTYTITWRRAFAHGGPLQNAISSCLPDKILLSLQESAQAFLTVQNSCTRRVDHGLFCIPTDIGHILVTLLDLLVKLPNLLVCKLPNNNFFKKSHAFNLSLCPLQRA